MSDFDGAPPVPRRGLTRARALLAEGSDTLAVEEHGRPELCRDDLAQATPRVHALYATARSLAALRGVDETLSSVVREAHDLMASDITYLSIFDDTGDHLTLRAGVGLISPEFRAASPDLSSPTGR